jgi:hypothetical protein
MYHSQGTNKALEFKAFATHVTSGVPPYLLLLISICEVGASGTCICAAAIIDSSEMKPCVGGKLEKAWRKTKTLVKLPYAWLDLWIIDIYACG